MIAHAQTLMVVLVPVVAPEVVLVVAPAVIPVVALVVAPVVSSVVYEAQEVFEADYHP